MISPSMVAFARCVDSIESAQFCARNGARDSTLRAFGFASIFTSPLQAPKLHQKVYKIFARKARTRLQASFTQASHPAPYTRFIARHPASRVYRIFAPPIVARLITRLALPSSASPQNLSTQNLNKQNLSTPSPCISRHATAPRHINLIESAKSRAPSGAIWHAGFSPTSLPPRAEVLFTQAARLAQIYGEILKLAPAKAPAHPKAPAAGFISLHSSADSTPPRHK